MTLNDKKPPRHAFEFAFKHDLSFKYELPVNGVMKECEVKVTYPILKSVDDCMCIVKDVKEKAMAIVCRGLLSLPLHLVTHHAGVSCLKTV